MKTVQDWNSHVVAQRMQGNRTALRDIILDYVTRYQCVKWIDLINYVYKKIGDDYRSKEFDAYIATTTSRLVKNSDVLFDGTYYSVKKG